jgi:uncharacterized protein YjiS (DUF1127 family)
MLLTMHAGYPQVGDPYRHHVVQHEGPVSPVTNGCTRVASWQKAVRWLARVGRRIVVEQRQRSAIRRLQALDDRMLADIGLRRGEIESAARGVTMS